MVGGVELGGAGVDDQIDEAAALRGDRLGSLFAQSAVLVRGDRFLGEDVDDDAGRHGFHSRTMHSGGRAIKQAQPCLCVVGQAIPTAGDQRRGTVSDFAQGIFVLGKCLHHVHQCGDLFDVANAVAEWRF